MGNGNGNLSASIVKWIIGITFIPTVTVVFAAGIVYGQIQDVKDHSRIEGHPPLSNRVTTNETNIEYIKEIQKGIKSDVKDIKNILIRRFGPPPEKKENKGGN